MQSGAPSSTITAVLCVEAGLRWKYDGTSNCMCAIEGYVYGESVPGKLQDVDSTWTGDLWLRCGFASRQCAVFWPACKKCLSLHSQCVPSMTRALRVHWRCNSLGSNHSEHGLRGLYYLLLVSHMGGVRRDVRRPTSWKEKEVTRSKVRYPNTS
jgi:hypothetical protein